MIVDINVILTSVMSYLSNRIGTITDKSHMLINGVSDMP